MKANAMECAEIEAIVNLWLITKSEEDFNRQLRRMDEIAKSHGLPDLPEGQYYMIRDDGEIIS
jgi:hypothetical protein